MTTTLAHINAHGSIRYVYVLAIEGYPSVITNSADTDAVATAWDRDAISGLRVEGDYEQSIEPWQRSLSPNGFRFYVMDADGSDAFGRLVFANASGNETELTEEHNCSAATLKVKDTTNFVASGTIYCGVEAMSHTGKTATTFTGVTRGLYSPFGRDGASEVGRDHVFADVDYGVQIQTVITDAPRHWKGKYVGLWMHRVVDDVVDLQEDAHLVYAGIIEDIQDTESGEVLLETQDIRARLKNTMLMHDQFTGRVADGIYLEAGLKFYGREVDIGTGGSSIATRTSNPLTVVASGASGAAQLDAGVYTVQELGSRITAWLAAETVAARLNGLWAFGLRPTDSGQRMVLGVNNVDAGAWRAHLYLPRQVSGFCGYGVQGTNQVDGIDYKRVNVHGVGAGEESQTANDPPMRVALVGDLAWTGRITLSGTQGTWIDQSSSLPQRFQQYLDAASEWGVFKVSNSFVLARRVDALNYDVHWGTAVSTFLGSSALELGTLSLEDEGEIEFTQVFLWEGTFSAFLLRALASTGTAGYNHSTYDDFPAQMGAAIPWSLLGGPLVDSLASLEAETSAEILVLIDKPTALETEILNDLLLRVAWLIWHQGTLKVAQFQNPLAEIAVHNFLESNKGSAVAGDPQRIVSTITSEHLVNVCKFAYDRTAFGAEDYKTTKTLKYGPSISDYGESKAFTINARHSYSFIGGGNINELAANVIGKLMPVYGRPVKILRSRTIQPEFFEAVAPGDLCTVDDHFARDPDTGIRGISSKPGLVLTKRYGWGGDGADMHGEVDLLISDLDNTAVYSPSAGIDATSYDTGDGIKFNIVDDYVSGSDNDAAHFAVGDGVWILEIDPADPASAVRWDTIINGITDSGGVYTVEVQDELELFDTSGATKYRMVSDIYSDTQATQKSKAYQADDADLRIENLRRPFIYGRYTSSAFSAAPGTELPERHSNDMFGDGVPLSTHTHRAAARFVTNAIDYKMAVQCPQLFRTEIATHISGTIWQLLYLMPVFFGPGNLGFVTRQVAAAPLARLSSAGAGKVRLTLSLNPPGTDSDTDVEFQAPYQQVTFDLSSTTYAIPTAQDIEQVGWFRRGLAYLSIEVQGNTTKVLGLGEWQQGPRT